MRRKKKKYFFSIKFKKYYYITNIVIKVRKMLSNMAMLLQYKCRHTSFIGISESQEIEVICLDNKSSAKTV